MAINNCHWLLLATLVDLVCCLVLMHSAVYTKLYEYIHSLTIQKAVLITRLDCPFHKYTIIQIMETIYVYRNVVAVFGCM